MRIQIEEKVTYAIDIELDKDQINMIRNAWIAQGKIEAIKTLRYLMPRDHNGDLFNLINSKKTVEWLDRYYGWPEPGKYQSNTWRDMDNNLCYRVPAIGEILGTR